MGSICTRAFALVCFLCSLIASYSKNDTLEQGKQLRYWEQLKSPNKRFTLGFFVPYWSNSYHDSVDDSFLGIWYSNQTMPEDSDEEDFPILPMVPVWIANRESPVMKGLGVLSVGSNGDLKILSGDTKVTTSLYSTRATINASASLQDDGNFVLRELDSNGSVKGILWQSFHYPTDTLLPGMKLGIRTKLRSWKSYYGSPAPGYFTLGLDPNDTKQLVVWQGGEVSWRSGSWQESSSDFQYFSGLAYGLTFSFIENKNQTYFTYTADYNSNSFPEIRISYDGKLFMSKTYDWDRFWLNSCSQPDISGAKSKCIKQKLPNCRSSMEDTFISGSYVSMSRDGFRFSDSKNLTIESCKVKCLLNCNCLAFATTIYPDDNITGCEIWTSSAKIKPAVNGKARTIYILPSRENKWWLWLTTAVGLMMTMPTLCSVCYMIWKKCTSNGDEKYCKRMLIKELDGGETPSISFGKPKGHKADRNELHAFSFESIAYATNYFSPANKLGEGGFGPVYKGILQDGQEVAIKRLSTNSRQGVAEFKNEALLIAKLQHTNLVRLLGFCIQGEENILIYEYMPNKSLDSFLFDSDQKKILNWKRRFIIIEGIAQGLLYLHKYSRLRVIHRDLKASNILLDNDMNPKISDFGMARIFGLNESEANTNRIVGTYGYMSPEYVFHGLVSIKTDVFSFGVLLLEVVTGRKNTTLYHPDYPLNLTGYVWQLWNEGRQLELMDPSMDESCPHDEILRCMHIGLLCVQDHAIDRPTMLDVVSMLSNETIQLPKPKKPGFFITNKVEREGAIEIEREICSMNQVSISEMEAR
ncbi:hypothetical protein SLA2020_361490 [Shorea laevis]